ncbi:MAG: ATP synthase F1 subunit delta [Bacteroidales bacterium]|nr:ATP synthase F1 subunit delta [Bacteroidales bacterium]
MKSTKLANRYANALYMFALEQNKLEEVYSDILTLKGVFIENRELRGIIERPVLSPDKKRHIFTEIFKGKIDDITFGFLNLILSKKREPSFIYIFDEFISCYYKHHNIKKAHVTSAVALDSDLLGKLKAILEEQTHSTIEIEQTVQPEIIGGFIIKIDDYLIDASLKGKINKLKLEFSHNIYRAAF